MAHNVKRHTEEFKRQIIDLYPAGKPVAVLAEEYGLIEQTIYKWKKLYVFHPLKLIKNNSFHSKIIRNYRRKSGSLKRRMKY